MAIQKLMRQKINVSPTMLFEWKRNLEFNLRNLINKHLLKVEDLNTSFEHQDRIFTIVGMTESENVILSETIDNEIYYWECTSCFVQLKLNRFYVEWKKVNGVRVPFPMVYEDRKLYLANNRIYRKKKEEVAEEEPVMETYTEDTYTEEESL
jgi:hypothetical protein